MEENINAIYPVNDTIFADDNTVLRLMYILETGHTEFFMALYNEKNIFKATIHRLESDRYQLKFSRSVFNLKYNSTADYVSV